MSLSVLTLVRGRERHLANLMRSLGKQSCLPKELVVAWMQPKPFVDLPSLPLPVTHVFVEGEDLPLAKARNAAATAASGETLMFLDVDCIASPTVVESYSAALNEHDGICLSDGLYLPAEVTDFHGDYRVLEEVGKPHVSKPLFPDFGRIEQEPDGGQLWGLSFAMRKRTWQAIGGMDERFVGYGGEETDFAASAERAGVKTYRVGGARVYHQHHPVLIPPLHNFDPILRNARLFHGKHGRWCMGYWLGQFREAGLIRWDEDGDEIQVLRSPDPTEVQAARQPGNVLYS